MKTLQLTESAPLHSRRGLHRRRRTRAAWPRLDRWACWNPDFAANEHSVYAHVWFCFVCVYVWPNENNTPIHVAPLYPETAVVLSDILIRY